MEMTDQEQVPKAAIVAFYRMEDLPPEADWQTRIFHWFFKRKCSNYEHCQFAFVRGMAGPGTFLTTTYTTTKAHPFSDRKIHYRNENWECYEMTITRNAFSWNGAGRENTQSSIRLDSTGTFSHHVQLAQSTRRALSFFARRWSPQD